jgi:hypothetical protein
MNLKSIRVFLASVMLHSGIFALFVFFVSNLSLSLLSAGIFSLSTLFLVSFTRFFFYGTARYVAFLGGGAVSTLWLPLTAAVLDWVVGGGPSPTDHHFYLSAARYIYAPEATRYTLAPALLVMTVDLFALFAGAGLHFIAKSARRP